MSAEFHFLGMSSSSLGRMLDAEQVIAALGGEEYRGGLEAIEFSQDGTLDLRLRGGQSVYSGYGQAWAKRLKTIFDAIYYALRKGDIRAYLTSPDGGSSYALPPAYWINRRSMTTYVACEGWPGNYDGWPIGFPALDIEEWARSARREIELELRPAPPRAAHVAADEDAIEHMRELVLGEGKSVHAAATEAWSQSPESRGPNAIQAESGVRRLTRAYNKKYG